MLVIKANLKEGNGWMLHGLKVKAGLCEKKAHAPQDVVEMGEEFAWGLFFTTGENHIVLEDKNEGMKIHIRQYPDFEKFEITGERISSKPQSKKEKVLEKIEILKDTYTKILGEEVVAKITFVKDGVYSIVPTVLFKRTSGPGYGYAFKVSISSLI